MEKQFVKLGAYLKANVSLAPVVNGMRANVFLPLWTLHVLPERQCVKATDSPGQSVWPLAVATGTIHNVGLQWVLLHVVRVQVLTLSMENKPGAGVEFLSSGTDFSFIFIFPLPTQFRRPCTYDDNAQVKRQEKKIFLKKRNCFFSLMTLLYSINIKSNPV